MTERVRPARPDDVPVMCELIHELATYERAADEVEITAPQLHTALFGPSPALFGHVALSETGEVVGLALWFLNFSTWKGTHGVYLEDLFVRPEHRGHGLGAALLRELAATCVRRGYRRLEWWVLDWNAPAIGFYRSVGAVPMDEWTVYRLTGEELAGFALPSMERPTGSTQSRSS